MGRRKIPTNLHLIRGNPSKLRSDQLADPVTPQTHVPTCPKHLSKDARAEWRRITPHLEALGLVSELDRAILAAYCQSYGRWVQAERQLKRLDEEDLVSQTPSGYKQKNIWLQIAQRSMEQTRKFAAEFGLSPAERSKVTPTNPQPFDVETPDPAGKYFR